MDEIKLSRTDSHKIEMYLTTPDGEDEYFSLTQLANEAVPTDSEALQRMFVKEQSKIEPDNPQTFKKARKIGAVGTAIVVPLSMVLGKSDVDMSSKLGAGLVFGAVTYGMVGELAPRIERSGIQLRNKRRAERIELLQSYSTQLAIGEPKTESE